MASPVDQSAVVLATKLTHPRLPTTHVVRDRLLADLNHALSHRLTLVSASAGWGKTTLLGIWINDFPHAVAWLSLDELDNDARRFWIVVIIALRTCLPEVGTLALAMLQSPEPPSLTAVLTTLLNELASRNEQAPLVLVVDDYHFITDQAIHESLAFLVEHLPEQVHVVLATRIDPDVPLARWRVRGELLEIRTANLRFNRAEATSFFGQTLGDVLTKEDVLRLEQRTEGWVAGLQLAALALRQRENRSGFVDTFTGNHRFLLDYVQAEILTPQEPDVQRFLLRTAVLRRMNAALCTALTNEPGGQAMLELLERSNLFVHPLDDQRQWYRVHDLFREVLLARLQATEPDLVPQLHGRAARWYAAQNEPYEAMSHALAARDFDYAAGLIEHVAPQLWVRGEAETVHAWVSELPVGVVQQHARLALDTALRLLGSAHAVVMENYRRMLADVEQTVARVEIGLGMLPAAEAVVLQGRIELLRALIAARTALTRGDVERMRVLADQATALAKAEEGGWKLIGLRIAFWYTESLQHEGGLLIPQLLAAKQQLIEAGNQLDVMIVMSLLAFASMRAGRLHAAVDEALAALELSEQLGLQSASIGYYYYILACAYRDSNQWVKAASAAQHLLQLAQTWQQADLLIVGNTELALIAAAQGDHATAEQALGTAEALVEQERFMTHTGWVASIRVHYWLKTGNLQAASAWAEQLVIIPESWNPNRIGELLVLVRVYIAQRQYERALAALDQFSGHLNRTGDRYTTLHFLALQVTAFEGAGHHASAHHALVRLFELTAEENHLRIFLDSGELMRESLQRLRDQQGDEEHRLLSATSAFVARLLAAFEEQAQHHVPANPRSNASAEPLTSREREVLRLLLAGDSNAEIAGELVISLATAKKHVSNLLGKLGVATRAQAIVRVRESPDLL